MVEKALLIALMALLTIGAVQHVGQHVKLTFCTVAAALQSEIVICEHK